MKQYSIIPTFQDCIKICELNKEFSHSVQKLDGKEVHSFKYNLSHSDMWEENDGMDGRFNMRGICFIDEKIVALPFPKFFNLEETKYTKNLDISKFKFANEKIDGSLISVFQLNGKMYCKSMKSVESDVSKEAQKYFDSNELIKNHAKEILFCGYSPMYEYVSPTCKIVIDYKETKMFFLGCRDMKTGKIFYPTQNGDAMFTRIPKKFETDKEINEYLKTPNVEGVVITLEDGQMVKVKTEEYCKIHRIISNFSDKSIVESIVEEKFDDLIGQLKLNNLNDLLEKAQQINDKFWEKYKEIEEYATHRYEQLIGKHSNRKDIAMEMQFSSMIAPFSHSIIFKLLDKKPIKDLIFKYLKNNVELLV